ncbi:MAG: hypothetical protein KF796_06160 [Ramlibacter sp.]|nr:hypothetical protein [Ramlibacter sp.]
MKTRVRSRWHYKNRHLCRLQPGILLPGKRSAKAITRGAKLLSMPVPNVSFWQRSKAVKTEKTFAGQGAYC